METLTLEQRMDRLKLSDHIAPQGDGNSATITASSGEKEELSDHIAPQGDGNLFFQPIIPKNIENSFRSHRPARGWKPFGIILNSFVYKLSDHIAPQGDGNGVSWIPAVGV